MVTREPAAGPGRRARSRSSPCRSRARTSLRVSRAMETCYRHPDRETGVSCSNCGRPICPDCMTTTSVGMRCPECASQRTKVKTMGSVDRADAHLRPDRDQRGRRRSARSLGGASATGGGVAGSSLLDDGSVSRFAVDRRRVLAHPHRGLPARGLHPPAVQHVRALHPRRDCSSRRSAACASASSTSSRCWPARSGRCCSSPRRRRSGASGAVFGLMGAAVVVMRNRGVNPMESGLGLWIGLNLLITFTIPNISIGGHIGGLIGGALRGAAHVRPAATACVCPQIAPIAARRRDRRRPRWSARSWSSASPG